jgi:hypothetical protein
VWFAVAVIVAFALSLGLSALVAPLKIGMLNLTVLLIDFLLGGAIAGRSLRVGRRGLVGFAFAVGLPILGLRLIGIQAMGGNEGF